MYFYSLNNCFLLPMCKLFFLCPLENRNTGVVFGAILGAILGASLLSLVGYLLCGKWKTDSNGSNLIPAGVLLLKKNYWFTEILVFNIKTSQRCQRNPHEYHTDTTFHLNTSNLYSSMRQGSSVGLTELKQTVQGEI